MLRSTSYLNKLNSWLTKFKRYTVTYKRGFFHLSNLANSPYTIIESFDKMPFCKHERDLKKLTADTPFMKAQLYYFELEEGLWIYVSDLNYRKNILMTNIYDKALPIEYHFLNLHYREKSIKSKSMMVNGLLLTDKTWSVFKAGHATSDYHFKGSDEKNITIYFTSDWLKRKLDTNTLRGGSIFGTFMESQNTYLLLADNHENSNYFYEAFLELTRQRDSAAKSQELHHITSRFFEYFFRLSESEIVKEDYLKLDDKDRKYVQLAENNLINHLTNKFPGIEWVAKKVGISPTKLKAAFKIVHNKTMYQFYSYHQMQLARELLIQKKYSVKEVASLLGYENASKFSARFKEEFGESPSLATGKFVHQEGQLEK